MAIIEGKTYYFYNDKTEENVCKAHILHVMPHPEREDDLLIVYRWFGKHRQRWWYDVTTLSQQKLWADYVKKVTEHRKQKRQCRKCGECGYFMRYVMYDGKPKHYGDCGSIGMNKECNEGVNPLNDEYGELLQVDESENACGFFKKNRTRRIKDYIKSHPEYYVQPTNFKPKPVR